MHKLLHAGLTLAGLLTTACDTQRDIELVTKEVEGPCKITLTQNVIPVQLDEYTLTVNDKNGQVIVYLRSFKREPLFKLYSDGKEYTLEDIYDNSNRVFSPKTNSKK